MSEKLEIMEKDMKEADEKEDQSTSSTLCCCGPSNDGRELGCCGIEGVYFPKRLSLLIVLTLGMTIINASRVNVGVTVVAILHKNATDKVSKPESMAGIASLDWSSAMVGWLHSMFYLGILISQVPCGYVVTKFSSTSLYGLCILLSGIFNLLLPFSITFLGYGVACSIRFIQGLSEGMLYPSCYDILRIWSLPEEKSRMGATVLTGSYVGPVLGLVFSGLLTHYCGWPSVFYAHGLTVMFWYIFWFFIAYESPAKHPCISSEERKLIASKQAEALVQNEKGPVPWFSIFTSPAVWSLNICNFARSSVFYLLLTNQPTYFHLFEFTFVENGVFSALPHAMMALVCILSGPIADLLLARPSLSTTFVRKLLTCVGFGVEGLLFFVLALITSNFLSVGILTLALGVSGLAISGWQINHLDIAPMYAGVLIAITMTFGTLAGVLNPLVVALLTEDQTLAGWHNVFWLTGAILLFSTTFYFIFGTGEKQEWASPKRIDKEGVRQTEDNNKPYGTFSSKPNKDQLPVHKSAETPKPEGVTNEGGEKGENKVPSDLKQRHPIVTS